MLSKGAPLEKIEMYNTNVKDLSPLSASPLKTLIMHANWKRAPPANDLSPLKNCPLETLAFVPETIATGFDELKRMKSLKKINGEPPNVFWAKLDKGDFFAGAEFKERLNQAWPGSGDGLRKATGKKLTLSLKNRKEVLDLEPLRGMPLVSLNIEGCLNLKDISGIRGLPLTSLLMGGCRNVADLQALSGMKLEKLQIHGCRQVKDITVLKGMPLESLLMHETAVQNLSPLAGMKLSTLQLHYCKNVRDISPLRNMKLKELRLQGTGITDITALKGMPLDLLELYQPGKSIPPISDLTPLKGAPLKTFSVAADRIVSGLTDVRAIKSLKRINGEPADLFWKKWDAGEFYAGAEFRQRLEEAWPGSSSKLTRGKGMTLSLSLRDRKDVTNLEPLKGMPLSNLDIAGCINLKDLTPLKGMPLTRLLVWHTQISDLSPLKGMPMTELDIGGCRQLSDIRPLAGMPLTRLHIHGTQIGNLAPLKGMPLSYLSIHRGGEPTPPVTDLTPLRNTPLKDFTLIPERIIKGLAEMKPMKSLKSINGNPPQVFWERYDKGDYYAGAEFKERLEKAWPDSTRFLRKAPGKHLTYSLRGRKDVLDLNALKGMPLTSLDIVDCPNIKDLSAIQDMKSLTTISPHGHVIARIMKTVAEPAKAQDMDKARTAAKALQNQWKNCPAMKKLVDAEIKKLIPGK